MPSASAPEPSGRRQATGIMTSTMCRPGCCKVRYLGHSAWLVETGTVRLLFDYGRLPARPAGRTPDPGIFRVEDWLDLPLTVFFSHQHGDHYDPALHRRLMKQPGVRVLLGLDGVLPPAGKPDRRQPAQDTDRIAPRSCRQWPDMTVWASGSTDSGVSFLVSCPSGTFYHGGDLAVWDDTAFYIDGYRREIDWLADRLLESGRTLDLAFLPVGTSDGYQEDALLAGLDYALAKLRPRHVLPMHGHGHEQFYRDFANRVQNRSPQWSFPLTVHVPGRPGSCVVIDRSVL